MVENIALTESTYYILLSLVSPQHGYGIVQQAGELSRGRGGLAAGTLYGALSAMVDKGWIEQLPVERGSSKKEHKLTHKSRGAWDKEVERLRELADNGERILGKAREE